MANGKSCDCLPHPSRPKKRCSPKDAQLDEIMGAAHLKLDADAIKRLNQASA
jgi:hypothetical protein